jgi:hypothetical protein
MDDLMEASVRNAQHLIEQAASDVVFRLRSWDYEIQNETELCHMFWASLLVAWEGAGMPIRALKAEIRLRKGGSVDLGVLRLDGKGFEAMIEAKAWFRPADASTWSKRNQPTEKRHQCVQDAKRLAALVRDGVVDQGGLLVLERASTHLQRLLLDELRSAGLEASGQWLDLLRPSIGRRKEQLGLLWVATAA